MNDIAFNNELTLLETAVLVGRAIAGREDFVYEPPEGDCTGCMYTHENGEPGCLIGVVAELAGIERPAYASYGNSQAITLSEMRFRFTPAARRFLESVQTKQDIQVAWGSAVEQALAEMKTWETV